MHYQAVHGSKIWLLVTTWILTSVIMPNCTRLWRRGRDSREIKTTDEPIAGWDRGKPAKLVALDIIACPVILGGS